MATKAPQTTKGSTRRLSEVARHVVIPTGIVSTGWPAIERKAAEFGDTFDRWQSDAGRAILGKRSDGQYAATIGGVVLSIPRQVAKTFLVGRIVFLLCVLFPGTKAIWTAHRTRTATMTFQNLQGYAKRKKVAPYVACIRQTNGEQEIGFHNGSVIMFGAREGGFGRGFDEVDIEVFDEASILTEKALEDMVAATNQSRHPHGALLFFMGTPPRPVDPGEAFGLRRKEALEFKEDLDPFGPPVEGEDMLYIECSADPDCDVNDRKQWALANPSYPLRTPMQSLLRLRKQLKNDDSWRREALGVWDEDADVDNPLATWALLADPESMATDDTVRLALDAPPSLTSATFSIAGVREDGLLHGSVRYHVPPHQMNDLVDLALKLTDGHKTDLVVAVNSPAKAFIADLEAGGVPLDKMTAADTAAAFGNIGSKVRHGLLRHRDQPELNNAVGGLTVRKSGDVDVPARRTSSTNIAPFIAVMCALYRVPTTKPTEFFAGAWR